MQTTRRESRLTAGISVLSDLLISSNTSVAPVLDVLKPFSPLVINTVKIVKDDKNH